jgi:hypothetical protein
MQKFGPVECASVVRLLSPVEQLLLYGLCTDRDGGE